MNILREDICHSFCSLLFCFIYRGQSSETVLSLDKLKEVKLNLYGTPDVKLIKNYASYHRLTIFLLELCFGKHWIVKLRLEMLNVMVWLHANPIHQMSTSNSDACFNKHL